MKLIGTSVRRFFGEGKHRHRRIMQLVTVVLLVICALCQLRIHQLAGLLESQRSAERWQGESETEFAQVSCFMPSDKKISLSDIYNFRNAMYTKLKEASFDIENQKGLINDAWCTFGTVNVSNGQKNGTVSVTAVGGSFFDFHPYKLLSGSYITPDDLMQDRVLLDEETAWLLFGGTELEGMSFSVNGIPFVVAGVFEREDDSFSTAAYNDGMGIFMSYDAYTALRENEVLSDEKDRETVGISCYEIVMAEPVDNFVYNAVNEKFPADGAELTDNTHRYGVKQLWNIVKNYRTRSMRLGEALYPYWENAARATEDVCAVLFVLTIINFVAPAAIFAYTLTVSADKGRTKLENDILPQTREKLEESVRVKARRRWELRHPGKK